jgi:precorrin-2 dehydrogenase / sirohydrochlorin ferrochelatase
MLPINVDLGQIRVVLVGGGERARRRLGLLDEAGAATLDVYAPEPGSELAAAAGARLRRRWPAPAEIASAQLVFVAGVPESVGSAICRVAKAAGVLINVEDDRDNSLFHSAAVIRRGDLTIAVSTGGRSPGLAALMRHVLDRRIGSEWERRLSEIAALRNAWRAAGAGPGAIGRRTRDWAVSRGWFDAPRPEPSQGPQHPVG